jgi:hypothetical protein
MKPPAKRLPLFHRLEVALGRPFGRHWVGEDEVAVIYEGDRFHALQRGPGFFNIDPLTQDVRAIVNVAPDVLRTTFPGIQTRDALPVELSVGLKFGFAPERTLREITHLVVRWTPEERRGVLVLHAQNALQKVLPEFTVDQVCRGSVFDEIERRTLRALSALVSHLGFEPTQMLLLQVTPPAELRERFANTAQRRVNAFDLAQYTPYELTLVMRAQLIEALSHMSPNRQYVEFPVGLTDVAPNPSPVIDAPPSHSSIQSDAEGKGSQDAPARKKRPRSRLEP